MIVSRAVKLFPYYIKRLEELGFKDVEATGEEKDSLNMVINELKPRLVMVESGFYHAGTPYMMWQLLKVFPTLNIAAVSMGEFPDDTAVWFIWWGVKSYVNFLDGLDEFHRGLQEIRQGKSYIAPSVRLLMNDFPEWPKPPDKVTRRRMEVLILICNGFKPESIGATLHVSRAMVNSHLQDLYHTFHVESRDELIRTAFAIQLVTDKDLIFYDRGKKIGPLPEWAAAKLKMRRY